MSVLDQFSREGIARVQEYLRGRLSANRFNDPPPGTIRGEQDPAFATWLDTHHPGGARQYKCDQYKECDSGLTPRGNNGGHSASYDTIMRAILLDDPELAVWADDPRAHPYHFLLPAWTPIHEALYGSSQLAEGWVSHADWGYVRDWWTQEWEDWSRLPANRGWKPGGGIAPGSTWRPLADDGPSEGHWRLEAKSAGLTAPGEDAGNGGNGDDSEDDETDEPDTPPTGDLAEVLRELAAIRERLDVLTPSIVTASWSTPMVEEILRRAKARTHEDLGMRSADEAILRRAEVIDERFQGGGPIRRTINSIWSAYRPAFLAAAWYGLTAYRRLMFNVVPTQEEILWRMRWEEEAGLD